jgi:autotransporter-associated beta strand protein
MHRARRAGQMLLPASLSLMIVSVAPTSAIATDAHFDYTSFETGFGQSQFDLLNYPSINGNYMMTSTDNHRPEMVANNNNLAQFYNNFLADYNTQAQANAIDATAEADAINAYSVKNSAKNGAKPTWAILNEISSSVWQRTDSTGPIYRQWVIDVATRLHDTYGFNVVTYAPFATVSTARAADWQALAAKSYIGIENYLSGPEVMAGGSDYASRVAWATAQYNASKTTYMAAGVSFDRLFLGEHFGNTASTDATGAAVGYGRAGLASASDWDSVLQIRQDAIRNVGFQGFLAYNWGGNRMNITLAEQLEHEYWYRTRLVLEGQQPQWLSDDVYNVNGTNIALNWGEQLNWIGGVPNASGAVANFYRTNTAARTVTLDGSKTVGVLSFNSAFGYTIAQGSGGSLTLVNGPTVAAVSVPQGSHTIAAPIIIGGSTGFDIAGSLAITGGVSTSAAKQIIKTGAGALTLAGANSFAAGTTFTANAGTTNFNSDASGNLTLTANAAVNFGASQHLAGLTVTSGNLATLAPGGSPGGSKVLSTGTLSVSGKLDLANNALIGHTGGAGTWTGSSYTGVTGLIASARTGGTWTGSGITTSSASGNVTTLGVATAAQVKGIAATATSTWSGETVTGSDTLAMYTYGGDANLDGKINVDDYTRIDFNVSLGSTGWFNGDFNYDGKINVDDYTIIDFNVGIQGPPLLAGDSALLQSVAPIPEPMTGSIALLITLASLTKRQRR